MTLEKQSPYMMEMGEDDRSALQEAQANRIRHYANYFQMIMKSYSN